MRYFLRTKEREEEYGLKEMIEAACSIKKFQKYFSCSVTKS